MSFPGRSGDRPLREEMACLAVGAIHESPAATACGSDCSTLYHFNLYAASNQRNQPPTCHPEHSEGSQALDYHTFEIFRLRCAPLKMTRPGVVYSLRWRDRLSLSIVLSKTHYIIDVISGSIWGSTPTGGSGSPAP